MRGWMRWALAAAVGGGALGCGGESATGGDGGGDAPPPLSEAALVATWSADITNLPEPIKVVLEVKADHQLVASASKRVAGPGGDSIEVVVQRETMTWSLASDGTFATAKVACRYVQPGDATATLVESECTAPVTESYPVAVSGRSLTTVKGAFTIVFTRE